MSADKLYTENDNDNQKSHIKDGNDQWCIMMPPYSVPDIFSRFIFISAQGPWFGRILKPVVGYSEWSQETRC
jgi:hypothetical protein